MTRCEGPSSAHSIRANKAYQENESLWDRGPRQSVSFGRIFLFVSEMLGPRISYPTSAIANLVHTDSRDNEGSRRRRHPHRLRNPNRKIQCRPPARTQARPQAAPVLLPKHRHRNSLHQSHRARRSQPPGFFLPPPRNFRRLARTRSKNPRLEPARPPQATPQ